MSDVQATIERLTDDCSGGARRISPHDVRVALAELRRARERSAHWKAKAQSERQLRRAEAQEAQRWRDAARVLAEGIQGFASAALSGDALGAFEELGEAMRAVREVRGG